MSIISLTRFRCCTKCGVTYPADTAHFYKLSYKLSKHKPGLQAECKSCRKIAIKKYQKTYIHPYAERRRKARRLHYLKNKGKENLQSKAYYWSNHEHRVQEMGKYRKANREYFRRWKQANREKVRQHDQDRKARKANAGGSYTQSEVWQMLEDQEHLCCYCETPLFGVFHVEHLTPLSRGGSNNWTNLGISCPSCNVRKSTKTAEEFMNLRNRRSYNDG